jgi:hypothetical protein
MAVLLTFGSLSVAQKAVRSASEAIPEKEIVALQKELAEAGEASASIRKRRAYKNVVRDGKDLLGASPTAPNRWRVLEIVFQSQKQLGQGKEAEKARKQAAAAKTAHGSSRAGVLHERLEVLHGKGRNRP